MGGKLFSGAEMKTVWNFQILKFLRTGNFPLRRVPPHWCANPYHPLTLLCIWTNKTSKNVTSLRTHGGPYLTGGSETATSGFERTYTTHHTHQVLKATDEPLSYVNVDCKGGSLPPSRLTTYSPPDERSHIYIPITYRYTIQMCVLYLGNLSNPSVYLFIRRDYGLLCTFCRYPKASFWKNWML